MGKGGKGNKYFQEIFPYFYLVVMMVKIRLIG